MWMMNGPRKVQPKSGNFVAADFTTILSWCTHAWEEVKKETILSGVQKAEQENRCRQEQIPCGNGTLSKKKEKVRKKIERERNKKLKVVGKKKKEGKAEKKSKRKRKATPKKKNRRKSPKRRVVKRKKVQRKKIQNKKK